MALITRPRKREKTFPSETVNFFLGDCFVKAFDFSLGQFEIINDKGGEPLALFNLYEYEKMGFRLVITPPLSHHIGLSISFRSEKLVTRQAEVRKVLGAMASYLTSHCSNCYLDLALPPEISDVRPFQEAGFITTPAYTYVLNLMDRSEEDLLKAMTSGRRKNIRDAEGSDLRIAFNPEAEEVVELVSKTLIAQGVDPHKKELFQLLKCDSECVFSVGAFGENSLEAVSIIGFDEKRAHYLAGGTRKESGVAGAYVLWNSILQAQKRKVQSFDFMGSSVPSIERYFRGFGGELTPYFRIKRNTRVFDTLKAAKRKLF